MGSMFEADASGAAIGVVSETRTNETRALEEVMGRSEREEIHRMRLERDFAMAQARDVVRQFNDELSKVESLTKRVVELEHQLEVWTCPNCCR